MAQTQEELDQELEAQERDREEHEKPTPGVIHWTGTIVVVTSLALSLIGCECQQGDSSCDPHANTYQSCMVTPDGNVCRSTDGINNQN